jgi:hypothetical protein
MKQTGESDQGFRLRRIALANGDNVFVVVDNQGKPIESSGDPAADGPAGNGKGK